MGKKARKEVSKKRAKSLAELVSENDELKRTQNTHDDQLVEVDLELQETKIALAEALAKIDVLEKEKEIDCIAGKQKGDKTMRVPKHVTAAELSKIVMTDFEAFKEHLERDYVMKKEVKKARMEVLDEDDLAVLHTDWAEQHKITEIKECQSAYFNGRCFYDLHTGYQGVTKANWIFGFWISGCYFGFLAIIGTKRATGRGQR